MKTSDFDYDLPQDRIAQYPVLERDHARLMILNRRTRHIEHRIFRDIVEYLDPHDGLVLNETKVFPARLEGIKEDTGARIEVLLLRRMENNLWEAMVRPGRRVPVGTSLAFGEGRLKGQVVDKTEEGHRRIAFEGPEETDAVLMEIGQIPLPPYIRRNAMAEDYEWYQTVYAKTFGAAAAPTAGLHFTPGLMEQIREMGIEIIPVLLHIGPGTFRPVTAEDPRRHGMDAEYYEVSETAAEKINHTRRRGGRVVAVGTTSVRVLETACEAPSVKGQAKIVPSAGWTCTFIYPPYPFRIVDRLLTNFHLPRSTLLMLVSAFAGRKFLLEAYQEALTKDYRFYSYGDAMLIL